MNIIKTVAYCIPLLMLAGPCFAGQQTVGIQCKAIGGRKPIVFNYHCIIDADANHAVQAEASFGVNPTPPKDWHLGVSGCNYNSHLYNHNRTALEDAKKISRTTHGMVKNACSST